MKPLRQMAKGFYLIIFRKFSASFTSIIGRVVGFGGVGGVDSTAENYFARAANIHVTSVAA
jgi:hypothetical protein